MKGKGLNYCRLIFILGRKFSVRMTLMSDIIPSKSKPTVFGS